MQPRTLVPNMPRNTFPAISKSEMEKNCVSSSVFFSPGATKNEKVNYKTRLPLFVFFFSSIEQKPSIFGVLRPHLSANNLPGPGQKEALAFSASAGSSPDRLAEMGVRGYLLSRE